MRDELPLKPCPFCGHLPEMRQHRASDGRWGGFYVECTACSIAIDEDTSTPTEAAIRWNLRAPVEITDELVERVGLAMIDAMRPTDGAGGSFCYPRSWRDHMARAAIAAALNPDVP